LQEWQQQHQQQQQPSASSLFSTSPSSSDQSLLQYLDSSQDFDHLLWDGSFFDINHNYNSDNHDIQQLALDCTIFDLHQSIPVPTLPDFGSEIPSLSLDGITEANSHSIAPTPTQDGLPITSATNASLLTPTPTIITSFESSQAPCSSASPISTCTPASASGILVPGLKLPSSFVSVTGKPKGKPGRKPAKKRPLSEEEDENEEVLVKRARNNLAAKRYRQKKVDRIEELENEVDEVKKERDDLRVELARREAEVKALREMLAMATGKQG
ncbi:b-ZIP transcription factor IDI-4, partial [Triangularia verruculosa]